MCRVANKNQDVILCTRRKFLSRDTEEPLWSEQNEHSTDYGTVLLMHGEV
jgi:hypothetical protein